MSIDLNWETLTSGTDGEALAVTIRDFIHDRFQTVTLPRFIRSVSVHSFDFGAIPPEVELKDICDPLPDFYEENGEDGDEDEDEDEDGEVAHLDNVTEEERILRERRKNDRIARTNGSYPVNHPPPYLDLKLAGLRSSQGAAELGSPFLGASTPGIPGGTSNLNYFHSQLATGLSGTQTPLAAVAGAHFQHGWPDYSHGNIQRPGHQHTPSSGSASRPSTGEEATQHPLRPKDSVSTFAAQTNSTRPHTQDGLMDDSTPEEATTPPRLFREPRIEDVQTVFRVKYSGDIKLSLTAEILLDYPMPSFVGIPVKLNITGLSFDGVAVLAYIRKRAHFCFLSPEDAITSIGAEEIGALDQDGHKLGGLLQEIKVESEIGQRENGKQSLKNVGKVEKFVLEQVRRIFEDEFVYPSFWTFLV